MSPSQAQTFPDMWVDPQDDPRDHGQIEVVDERTNLREYLRVYRITLRMKTDGSDHILFGAGSWDSVSNVCQGILDGSIEPADGAKQIQADAPKAAATMAQIDAMIPEGAPVAWFPTLVSDFFKKQGVEKITTRMSSEVAEKDLAGYRRINWGVDVPRVDCLAFAASLAELENQEPLLEIQGLTIETLKEDPEAQHVLLTLNNIVKP